MTAPRVYWIDLTLAGRLAIMARPRAGDWLVDEISGWRTEGIDVVVSLLEREEITELGLQQEADLCRAQGMEFISFPIPDRGVPSSLHEAASLIRSVETRIKDGKAVAIHCRAGIGRSSLIAACALVRSGTEATAAFEAISKARGIIVPDTDGQREWVSAFRDASANDQETGWGGDLINHRDASHK